jgi:hypothetical protein
MAPCSLVEVYQYFRGAYCSNFWGSMDFWNVSELLQDYETTGLIALMMEAVSACETSACSNGITWLHIPEDYLHIRRCENLQYHLPCICIFL